MTAFDLNQIDRVLTTTKSVRRRLDLSRPVARQVVIDCIRLASYAPERVQRPGVEVARRRRP